MTTTIGPIEIGEVKALKFDFSGEAAVGALLAAPVSVVCTVLIGVDPSPALVLDGAASVSGLILTQGIKPGVVGVTYKISCLVPETLGSLRHRMSAIVKVVPA